MFDKNVWMEAVLADKNLLPSAKIVANRLHLHHNSQTGRCNPSLPTLARGVNLTVRAVQKAIVALRDAGFLSWTTPKAAGSSSYKLERITVGQPRKAETPSIRQQEEATPLNHRSRGMEPSFRGDPGTTVPANTGISNPRKNSVSSDAQGGTGTQRGALRSGQNKVSATFTTIPDDFKLTPERRQAAINAGIIPSDIDKTFRQFRFHHEGKGTRSPKWESLWSSWCMNKPSKMPKVSRPSI